MTDRWVLLALVGLAALHTAAGQSDGLGLGGLDAPAPEAEATVNIEIPTKLCTADFCLADAPKACGGDCILTPLGNTTRFCAEDCIAVWNGQEAQTCLAGKATGVYIQEELTALATKCNAGAIAAARQRAAVTKYNRLFPCTRGVNGTILLGLDTCPTGSNATATNCPTQCASALTDLPADCLTEIPDRNATWQSTVDSCVAAAAPGASPGTGSSSGIGFLQGPSAGPTNPDDQAASPRAVPSAAAGTVLAAAVGGALLLGSLFT